MKKTLLIISALVFLNSSTELHQLFRLPLLLEHYRRYQEEDRSLSLVDFLKIHYAGNHPDDKDDKEDSKLPFKSVDNLFHTDSPLIVKKDIPARPFTFIKDKLTIHHPADIPDGPDGSIFHPPQSL